MCEKIEIIEIGFFENSKDSNDLQNLLQFMESNILDKLESFITLLLKWGKIHNLTGAKDAAAIQAQVFDSMLACYFLKPFKTCIDIGSGAGFPGIILALMYPNSFFYLLEPRAKRAAFLQTASTHLELKNVKIIKDFSYNVREIKADLITSRAVSDAKNLLKNSLHLLESSGHFLLFKGQNSLGEYKDLSHLDSKKKLENLQIFSHNHRFFIYAKFIESNI